MICTTYFLTFFSELIPPTGYYISTNCCLFRVLLLLLFEKVARFCFFLYFCSTVDAVSSKEMLAI